MKIIVATEQWNTKRGTVSKAVVRTVSGTFLGATNQTQVHPTVRTIKVSDMIIVGR